MNEKLVNIQVYGKNARILGVNGCYAPIYTQNSVTFFSKLSNLKNCNKILL